MKRTVRALAGHLFKLGEAMRWVSPTDFPVSNAEYVPDTDVIALPDRQGKRGAQLTIADGHLPKLDEWACKRSGPANYVHSMDASHLIRTVLAAAHEEIEMLTIHDSFSTLAPNATLMRKIINVELAALYTGTRPLEKLVRTNLSRVYSQVEHREHGDKSKVSWFYAGRKAQARRATRPVWNARPYVGDNVGLRV